MARRTWLTRVVAPASNAAPVTLASRPERSIPAPPSSRSSVLISRRRYSRATFARDETSEKISRELQTAREFKREENALENIVNYFERVAAGRLRNVTVIESGMSKRDCLRNDL